MRRSPGPDFLVIGAGRSGTTSLHHHLAAHPEVFVPAVKAPSHFYAVDAAVPASSERRRTTERHFVRDREQYLALFAPGAEATARGEVSPAYLAAPRVADRIAREVPDVRLVALLRNPVDRFHARYVARRRDGLERVTDEVALVRAELAAPLDLVDTAGTYLAAGHVSGVLERYLRNVGADRLRCHLHDDLVADPAAVIGDILGFIGVDPDHPLDVATRHNASGGEVRNPVVRRLWQASAAVRVRVRPFVPVGVRDRAFRAATGSLRPTPMPDEARRLLVAHYRDEVARLGELLGRDLSHWSRLDAPRTEGSPS